jgi:hypothetical protein
MEGSRMSKSRQSQIEAAAYSACAQTDHNGEPYYVENCELICYEPVGGDGAPTGYLPYPMEWTAAKQALESWSAK